MRKVEGLASVEGGYDRTGSRSPMQWDHSTNAGFSTAPKSDLYISQDESVDRPTASDQMADEHSLRSEIKRLIEIRQSHEALQSRGEIIFIYAEKNAYPLAYIRSCETEQILVVINPSDHDVVFPCEYVLKEPLYSFGGKLRVTGEGLCAPARSAGFYKL